MNIRSRKLLDFADGAACQNCGRQDGTVVAAHANSSKLGKGMSIKADDPFHAHLCNECHGWLDQGGIANDPTGRYAPTKAEKWEMFCDAMHRTWAFLWKSGLIGVVKK